MRRADFRGLYLIGGLEIAHVSVDFPDIGIVIDDVSETNVGLNLGLGVEYAVQPKIELFGELTYAIIADYNATNIGAGARFLF